MSTTKISDTEEAGIPRESENDSLLPVADKVEANLSSKSEETPNEIAAHHPMSKNKLLMSIAYMLAMGVCGIVLVALGSTLDDLADNVGRLTTEIGSVFIARGVGAILGAIISAKIYVWFDGNTVMAISLLFITLMICILPANANVTMLHVYFLLLGLGTAITDTGCQIMTRKLHGKTAGPWLGANTVAFGISGAIVPLIEIITDSLQTQYFVMAVIVFSVGLLILFGPNEENPGPRGHGRPQGPPAQKPPHYYVEMVVALMVFCFIGGKVTSTAYLDTYVDETNVISTNKEATLLLVLWLAITVGRLAGVQDQRFLTNKTLPLHLSILCVGGFLSMVLIMWFPMNASALWIGIASYGLFNGPCVGYCYDWNNRITFPTEKSMSIVMFGLNFGASLVPFFTTYIWNHGGGPKTLIMVIFASMFLPLPLLYCTKYISYDPAVNPRMKYAYVSLSQDEKP